MIASANFNVSSPDRLQESFVAELLPRVELHARISFRHVRCADQRADKINEAVALAWKWFVRLVERKKDVSTFPMAFTFLVVKAVNGGRRVTGMERAKDVMNPLTQRRHGFQVEPLPTSTRTSVAELYSKPHGQQQVDAFEEILKDDSTTPVPDQAAFRIDWPRFFRSLPKRDRRLARFLAMGNSGKDAANKFHLSQGRVTQLRQRWCREWRAFQGE
jgi:hypothetical protein